MIKSSLLISAVMLFAACDGDTARDGSKGPSRISTSSLSNTYNEVNIEALKRFNTEGVAVDIALSKDGRIAYIASGDAGIEMIDISSPAYPHLIFNDDLPEYANFVDVKDSVVYVGNQYSVRAYDIQNPYRPYYLGRSPGKTGLAHSAATSGAYYYEVNPEGLEIYQYHDAKSVEKVASYYLHDTAYALALHRNYIFIANGKEGLTVLKTNLNGIVGQVH